MMQNGMVESLRRSGFGVQVSIIDSLELADVFAAEQEASGTGKGSGQVVFVVDGIALLFVRAHLSLLRACSSTAVRGSVAIVHVPFSSDATYMREAWVREAVPEGAGEEGCGDAQFLRAVREAEVASFKAVSVVLAVACGDLLAAEYGVDEERLVRVSPADESWKPLVAIPRRQPRAQQSETVEFVTVGTLCERKNQLVLLDALALLSTEEPSFPRAWKLHIVGEESAEAAYAARVRARAEGDTALRGRVLLHGMLPQSACHALLARCDAYLFSSTSESFGMAADEAVSIGLPVLAFRDAGPVVAMLPPAASVLVADAMDARQWADALLQFVKEAPVMLVAADAEAGRRAEQRARAHKELALARAIRELIALGQQAATGDASGVAAATNRRM